MNVALSSLRLSSVVIVMALLSMSAFAQVLTIVSTQPVGTSATAVSASIRNDTTSPFYMMIYPYLFLVTSDGELVQPRYSVCSDVLSGVPAGGVLGTSIIVPDPPSTTPGSYVLFFPFGFGAVARLDVGTPSSGFPDIHVFPSSLGDGFRSHAFDIWGGSTYWSIANTSANAFTFAAGDRLTVEPAGGGAAVATVPLAGLTVAPGKVALIPLPTLPLAPYMVDVRWTDPTAGPQVRRIGVRDFRNVDLQFPRGRDVPMGGSIDAVLTLRYDGLPNPPVPPLYALAVGTVPGTTGLPGGAILPLALEPLVLESLNSGIFGLLASNVGTTGVIYVPFCTGFFFLSPIITLSHPNVPALSGTVLRVAAATYEPSYGLWGASQVAEIRLQ
jgi:hypothetical protein